MRQTGQRDRALNGSFARDVAVAPPASTQRTLNQFCNEGSCANAFYLQMPVAQPATCCYRGLAMSQHESPGILRRKEKRDHMCHALTAAAIFPFFCENALTQKRRFRPGISRPRTGHSLRHPVNKSFRKPHNCCATRRRSYDGLHLSSSARCARLLRPQPVRSPACSTPRHSQEQVSS